MKILIIIQFLLPALFLSAQESQYIGIPSRVFNQFYTEQNKAQWCWAASIQMILNYYGIHITQEEIVRKSYGMDPYGNLPDWPASFDTITENLNNWIIGQDDERFLVKTRFGHGPPRSSDLYTELSKQHPVLLAYRSGLRSGHAVVCTAISYDETENGPRIRTIIVRDPWESKGRIEYGGGRLADKITNYWFISVQRL